MKQGKVTQPKPLFKLDEGKPTYDLIPWEALSEVNKVLVFGAYKYGPQQWREGGEWLRLFNATLRHLFAWVRGDTLDPESGCNHLAHAVCNLLFLLTFAKQNLGIDDRTLHPPQEETPS